MSKELLISPEDYLKSGIHIGTKYKTNGMNKYIFKLRRDGLKVFSIETIDDRIKSVAKFFANYDMSKVCIVGRRLFAKTAIEQFCKITGARPYVGRFIPGKFTNTTAKNFFEPELVFIVESNLDKQAIAEANILHIPVIGLSSTNNETNGIDLVIPSNNKGKKSVALIFWLLVREYQFVKGIIKSRNDFTHKVEEFEYTGKEKPMRQDDRRDNRDRRGPRRNFNNKRR